MDRDPGVLVGVRPALRGDRVFLVGHRLSGKDVAVLEDGGSIAEDEVDSAVDVAFAVELAEGVDVECVLVALEAASVERGEVGLVPDCYGLVLCGAGRVLECDVYGDESVSGNGCNH